MRVAVIHDWLYIYGGAERVLKSILATFPNADLFTLFDVMTDADRARLGVKTSITSFLQKMPGIRTRHRSYLLLMPLAIEQLDLTAYDLVVSSSYAVAKGVLTGPDQLHLSYVHSPMRYAWDLQHRYLSESGLKFGVRSIIARVMLHKMRLWDSRTAHGVDAYACNSHFIARRIQKAYGRQAEVIYPPVAVPDTRPGEYKRDFFLTACRLVPYKNVLSIVEAFASLPEQRLMVAGTGPEMNRLRKSAGPNVTFLGFITDAELQNLMERASAFVYAAEEDFGIVMVEAQARGAPVIALGSGGAREIVVSDGPSPTGLFFDSPNAASIVAAIQEFLKAPMLYRSQDCYENARRFSQANFDAAFRAFVARNLELHQQRTAVGRHRSLAVAA